MTGENRRYAGPPGMTSAARSLALAVEPIPVEFGMFGRIGSREPAGGGARVYFLLDGEVLPEIASAAGGTGDLRSPDITDEAYFGLLLGGSGPERWRWDRWTILLSRGPFPEAEVTLGVQIQRPDDVVVWQAPAELPALPPDATTIEPRRLSLGDLRFDRASYDETVEGARALYRAVAPRRDADGPLGPHGEINTALRRLRVVQGLIAADEQRERLGDVVVQFATDRERWAAIRRIARALGVGFEAAEAVLATYGGRQSPVRPVAELAAEAESLTRELAPRAGSSPPGVSMR